jgi:hypothetical protein
MSIRPCRNIFVHPVSLVGIYTKLSTSWIWLFLRYFLKRYWQDFGSSTRRISSKMEKRYVHHVGPVVAVSKVWSLRNSKLSIYIILFTNLFWQQVVHTQKWVNKKVARNVSSYRSRHGLRSWSTLYKTMKLTCASNQDALGGLQL